MLVLFVALAVFVAWSWLSYPAIGHWLYDLSTALEARMYKLHKIEVPIAEMTVSTWQGGPYEAASAILMLHGYSAEKNLWLRFARHFVRQYRVIIPDIAGHGETGFKAGGGYDIALQAKRQLDGRLHRSMVGGNLPGPDCLTGTDRPGRRHRTAGQRHGTPSGPWT